MGVSNRVTTQRKQSGSGLSLAENVLRTVSDQIKTHVQHGGQTDAYGFAKYFDKPVEFIEEILQQQVTPDQKKICQSVLVNVITLAESANAVGKTNIAAALAIWFFCCRDAPQVYTAAAPPEDNLKRLLWGEIGKIIERNPAIFSNCNVSTVAMEIKRSAAEFIVGVTIPQAGKPEERKARFSGKHAPSIFFEIDEGDAVPPDIFEAIETCMSGGFARLLITYNPRSKSGYIPTLAKSGTVNVENLSAFTHPNVIAGLDVIPGAVTREATLRRIAEMTRPYMPREPLTDTFMVPSFLVGQTPYDRNGKELEALAPGLRKIESYAFSYMVLGRASSTSEDQLIDRGHVEQAIDRYKAHVRRFGSVPIDGTRPRIGLDVAEFGKDSNILTTRYGALVTPQDMWKGMDVIDNGRIAGQYYEAYNASEIYIDANGLGTGTWAAMNKMRNIVAHRVMVTTKPTEQVILDGTGGNIVLGDFYSVRDQGWWAMREWFRLGEPVKDLLGRVVQYIPAMVPPSFLQESEDGSPPVIDQLCAATYSTDNPRRAVKICPKDEMVEKLNNKSPDGASSLMMTFCPRPDAQGLGTYTSFNYLR
jgi:hypothetical protein